MKKIEWIKNNLTDSELIYLVVCWWNIWFARNQNFFSNKDTQNIDVIVRKQIDDWNRVIRITITRVNQRRTKGRKEHPMGKTRTRNGKTKF